MNDESSWTSLVEKKGKFVEKEDGNRFDGDLALKSEHSDEESVIFEDKYF